MNTCFPTAQEMSRREIFTGVTVSTSVCEHMMLSLAELQPDAVVATHSHPHEQVGVVLQGRVRFFIGPEEKVLGAGDLFCIPGNTPHRVTVVEGPARVLDIFHPVRDEYR